MKKILGIMVVMVAVFACNCGDPKPTDGAAAGSETPKTPEADPAEKYAKAIELIAGSDCLTCHKVDEKVNGPSYRDVAAKYESTDANIEMLSKKVIEGGSGVWGAMAMTPHPSLAPEDAKEMVKYILSLKK
ncbi:MAG: c-type cytochrome [Flavitalea sp.]